MLLMENNVGCLLTVATRGAHYASPRNPATVEERSNRAFTKPSFFHSLIIPIKKPQWGFGVTVS
tara:strand:- start:860 stop:1051 length:192 start_codon:yes stop_codon:yes gene_type:complete